MKTTVIEGWKVVTANGDGRGETQTAYFSNKKAAQELVATSPSWMRMFSFTETIVVFDSYSEYVTAEANAFKAKALSKLTKEEREALGV